MEIRRWRKLPALFARLPEFQGLSEVDQRRFIMLCCYEIEGGWLTKATDEQIAKQLSCNVSCWILTKKRLLEARLVTKRLRIKSKCFDLSPTDYSTNRVRAHRDRARRGRADVTLHETLLKQGVTVTETLRKKERKKEGESGNKYESLGKDV